MKLLWILLLVLAQHASAQTGKITFTPINGSEPGHIEMLAGRLHCNALGNWAPASWVTVCCDRGVPGQMACYPMPIFAQTSVTLGFHSTGDYGPVGKGYSADAITIILTGDANGQIHWQATATPATPTGPGEPATASGVL